MAKHVLLMKATNIASLNILVRGADGLRAQKEAIEALGGLVVAQFVVTGDYDLVLIVDLPNDASVLALSLASNMGGLYVDALKAYEPSDVDGARAQLPEIATILEAVAAESRKSQAETPIPPAQPTQGIVGA